MIRHARAGALLCVLGTMGCSPEIITENGSATSSTSVGGATGTTSSSSSSSGGVGGTGGTGGSVISPPPECTFDSDCNLINDCCTCMGASTSESFPDCPTMECFAPACNAIGLATPTAVCRAGQCVVDADCNHDHVLCKSLPPVCPPGKTPHVVDGCWGGCIDIAECREVGSCTQCSPNQACVTANMMMQTGRHCVDIPDSCMGQITCNCMGEMVCGFAMGCFEPSAAELKCVDITTK